MLQNAIGRSVPLNSRTAACYLSNSTGSGNDNEKGDKITSDPFGVTYEDGETNLGPASELPPKYIRDPVSGKLTGETEHELTEEEKELLNMSDEEKEAILLERFMKSWEDDDGKKEDSVAKLIRREKMRLNPFGRKASDLPKSTKNDYDDMVSTDDDDSSAPLSPSEFSSFQAYLGKHHKASITTDDIPTITSPVAPATDRGFDPDQDLSWIHSASKMDGASSEKTGDAWMEDIMPSDLAPSRKLNRKDAKPIPKELLHHNNMSLLRRYVTPGGQILNRVQSRLGAKDQRKVAKLVKRARALGLIPHIGQWKYEDHGDLFAEDIGEDREWEKELKERGLVIEHKLEDYKN